MLERINKEGMEFLQIQDGTINILFSIATNNISYKINDEIGRENLEKLKEKFGVDRINFTNQIHSDLISNLDEEKDSTDKQADALILSRKNEIVGVFTADCVPVILYDKEKEIISAIHSGWKGTIADISKKAVKEMINKYSCKNIKAIIGPCVGKCCYEVSNDLVLKFEEKYGKEVATGRMLDLKYAIKKQLEGLVKEIQDLNLCTSCNSNYELHSYRKKEEQAGRLFSFAFIQK